MAEFTCIVNCSDFVNWYIDGHPPRPKDNVTKLSDNPSPGLWTAKLQIRAECCHDHLIECSSFAMFPGQNMHIITVAAVLHIVQGMLAQITINIIITLCAYAQQGYVFGHIGLCTLYVCMSTKTGY